MYSLHSVQVLLKKKGKIAHCELKMRPLNSISIHHLLSQSQIHMAATFCFQALASKGKSSPCPGHAHML